MLFPIRKIRSTIPPAVLVLLFYLIYRLVLLPLKNHKIDWHDYESIEKDLLRKGKGEHGFGINGIPKKEAYSSNGFNGDVSDLISIHRSIPDIRHHGCKKKLYKSHLPSVSFVIPFHNEHPTVLYRTFHSILSRAPRSLIKEIILVDDASTKTSIKKPLDEHIVQLELQDIVRVIRLPNRGGLITARLAGAKAASGEVLLFLDSHTEANVNFLPPLLEPISEDYKTAVCPFIDVIDHDTFAYRAQDEGRRGAFDWQLYYKRLPLLKSDLEHPTEPFKSPVMAGGLFAISSQFFWELGGYDEGLEIWGGEQYELSFKIWQCGGQLVDAPCSRIGHIYRAFVPFSSGGKNGYMQHNYKRVAEVWMDEYKEFLYKKSPFVKNANAGDISKQKAIRERLQCKSFKWFMEEVAFDLVKHYPPVEPPEFASGHIRTVEDPNQCIRSRGPGHDKSFFISQCDQNFHFSFRKDVRFENTLLCWDASPSEKETVVGIYSCHGQGGNQLFRYDPETKRIIHGHNFQCLQYDLKSKTLVITSCSDSIQQQWTITNVNLERIKLWDTL